MSDEHDQQSAADRSASEASRAKEAAPLPPSEMSTTRVYRRRTRSWAAPGLATLLILVIAGVLSSPFWAPAVMSVLPWGEKPAAKYDALVARVTALEQRPAAPPIDAEAIKSTQAELAQRIAALEAGVAAARRDQDAAAQTKSTLAELTERVNALVAQSTARAAAQTAEIDKLRQELARRGVSDSALANRLDALEGQLHAQKTPDQSGSVRLLALLQMREAVEAAQPFPAEYAAFKALVSGDPKLAAAAEPLADAARDGVASHAVLRRRLAEIADRIATAKAPPAKPKWWAGAVDRLRGLVTIRSIDGTAKTGPAALVDTAQTDLAEDDLAGAIAALDKLTGANAAAAQPWLGIARPRLAAETALTRLQELLTAEIGSPKSASPSVAAPTPAPGTAPAPLPSLPKTPS